MLGYTGEEAPSLDMLPWLEEVHASPPRPALTHHSSSFSASRTRSSAVTRIRCSTFSPPFRLRCGGTGRRRRACRYLAHFPLPILFIIYLVANSTRRKSLYAFLWLAGWVNLVAVLNQLFVPTAPVAPPHCAA